MINPNQRPPVRRSRSARFTIFRSTIAVCWIWLLPFRTSPATRAAKIPESLRDQPVPGFNLSLNGGRPGSTTILADGVNNTGVGIARAVVSFTPETVQEFTVQTSALIQRSLVTTGGGVINATTKSGTNRLQRRGALVSPQSDIQCAPVSHRHGTAAAKQSPLQSGFRYTVGGPVYLPKSGEGGKAYYDGHDKTFFFFAYEPRWRRDFLAPAYAVADCG